VSDKGIRTVSLTREMMTDTAPGLLRADGSLCLDLLPMEYYGQAFRVVHGPLYNPESIDRDKVYATTTIGEFAPGDFSTFYQRVTPDWGKI